MFNMEPSKDPSDARWAWFAGIFEAQGSVAYHRTARHRVRLQFKSADEDVVVLARARIGGKVFGPYQYTYRDGVARKPFWIWASDGLDPREVTAAMWPWLGDRRRTRLRAFLLEPDASVATPAADTPQPASPAL